MNVFFYSVSTGEILTKIHRSIYKSFSAGEISKANSSESFNFSQGSIISSYEYNLESAILGLGRELFIVPELIPILG